MEVLTLDVKTTGLVLIDLEKAIVGRAGGPHAGKEVVERGAKLAKVFRGKGAVVVYVRVDLADMVVLPVDQPARAPGAPLPPAEASELVPEAGFEEGDLLITKRQWGAFFGTDLETQLRQRGVETVVVGGIATNFGVESTVRAAAGLGFAVVVPEDACTSVDAEAHRFAVERIFPRIARVRSTEQVIAALGAR